MSFLSPQASAAITSASAEPFIGDIPIAEVRADARATAAASPREDVLEVREVFVGEHQVLVRAYRPVASPTALVLHAHGGGFVFNDVEVHDALARSLANRTGAWVLSVDYRRPPEHRFPAAVEDFDAVVSWLAEEGADQLGLPAGAPVSVHGDSAGGNLALVTALRHPGTFAAVALIYPFLDPQMAGDSWRGALDAFQTDEGAWYWDQYAATPDDLRNPALAPLQAKNLDSLPPTLVLTAEHDPCRDEGEELARVLSAAGVEVFAIRLLGAVHGFYRHPDAFDVAEPALRSVAGFLSQHLAR